MEEANSTRHQDLWHAWVSRLLLDPRLSPSQRRAVPMDRSDQRRTGTRRGAGVGPRRSATADLRISRRHPHRACDGSPNPRKTGLVPKSLARGIRSGDLRRRAGWAQRGCLWRLGGPEDRCDRALCRRRAGRQQSEDRELSGISGRHQRRGSRRARPRAGMPVRRGNSGRPCRCPRRSRRRQGDRLPRRWDKDHRSRVGLRHWGRLPPIRSAERGPLVRSWCLLRRRCERGHAVQSSGGVSGGRRQLRRARRRCILPAMRRG